MQPPSLSRVSIAAAGGIRKQSLIYPRYSRRRASAQRFTDPAIGPRLPAIGHVLRFDAETENELVQRIGQAAARDEEDRAVLRGLKPSAQDPHAARAGLAPWLRIGGQLVEQALMRLQPKLALDVGDDQPPRSRRNDAP